MKITTTRPQTDPTTGQPNCQACVLELSGDLVDEASASLASAAGSELDDKVRDLVIDMGSLEAIDSRGLEMLLTLQERCEEQLGQLVLASPSEDIQAVLCATRLDARLTWRDDIESAKASLG